MKQTLVVKTVLLLVATVLMATSLSGCAMSQSEMEAARDRLTQEYRALPGVASVQIDSELSVAGGFRHVESKASVMFSDGTSTDQEIALVRKLFALSDAAKLNIYDPVFTFSNGSNFKADDKMDSDHLTFLIDASKWHPNAVPTTYAYSTADPDVRVTISAAKPADFLIEAAQVLASPPAGLAGGPVTVSVAGPKTEWEYVNGAVADHPLTDREKQLLTELADWMPDGVMLVGLSASNAKPSGSLNTETRDTASAAEFERLLTAVWPQATVTAFQMSVLPNPQLPGKTYVSTVKYYPS